MNAKKIANFLVLRSAFTQRNLTSLMLVGVFFGVYVLSGGKVTTKLPRIQAGDTFGTAVTEGGAGAPGPVHDNGGADQKAAGVTEQDMSQQRSRSVLGITPTEDQAKRQEELLKRGRLFDSDPNVEPETDVIDEKKLVEGADFSNYREEFKLKKSEKRRVDKLSAIEDRLKATRK